MTTSIAAPPDACFDLVLNVDVQRSLGTGMDAVAGVTSGPLQVGDSVTWRARHFGLVWHMTSKIVEVERPHYFRDEMEHGPFEYWRHVHHFQSASEGTLLIDDVDFAAPLGPAGRIFQRLILDEYMRRLLVRRNRDLKKMAERRAAAQTYGER